MIWILAGSVAGGLLLITALRAAGAPMLSPGVVGVSFYIVMGALGAIAAAQHSFLDDGAAHQVLAFPIRNDTMLVFAAVAGAIGAGASLAQLVLGHRGLVMPDLASIGSELTSAAPGRGVLVAAVLPLLLELVGLGPALFHATAYLQSDGPSAAWKIGGLAAPVGFLAAAYLAAQRTQRDRFAGRALCLCYAVVAFGTATRGLGMLPLLWLLTIEGLGVGGGRGRRAFRAVWVLGLTYVGLSTALVARGLTVHGLIPHLSYFAHHASSLVVAPNDAADNLFFGYPLTSFVVHVAPTVGQHAIQTSLNPLPGSMTDWGTIAPLLRAHPFLPFNALGELFSYNPLVAVVYFMVAGFLFQYAAAALLGRSSSRVRLAIALAVLAAAAFFMVTSLEYNTRTITRTLWYLVALVVIAELWVAKRAVWRKALWRPDRRDLVPARR